jgi:hypothetical protein
MNFVQSFLQWSHKLLSLHDKAIGSEPGEKAGKNKKCPLRQLLPAKAALGDEEGIGSKGIVAGMDGCEEPLMDLNLEPSD